jgi:hypothetical protein
MTRRTRSMATGSSALAALLMQRAHACRLTPDRALQMLEEAEAFLAERGMLTLTPSCALPSLFAACHEEPYRPGGHGFASWPRNKWWWGGALAGRPGVSTLRILQGKQLFLSGATVGLVDPLCRAELKKADRGEHGRSAQELVSYLAAAGIARLDEVKAELGMEWGALGAIRIRLERVGAVVSRPITVEAANGGERETSELARWDQRFPDVPHSAPQTPGGLGPLIVAGVRAAVVAPMQEVVRWFSWRVPADLLDELIARGQLQQPQSGWVVAAPPPSAPQGEQ